MFGTGQVEAEAIGTPVARRHGPRNRLGVTPGSHPAGGEPRPEALIGPVVMPRP